MKPVGGDRHILDTQNLSAKHTRLFLSPRVIVFVCLENLIWDVAAGRDAASFLAETYHCSKTNLADVVGSNYNSNYK